jgi:hypothetical protein
LIAVIAREFGIEAATAGRLVLERGRYRPGSLMKAATRIRRVGHDSVDPANMRQDIQAIRRQEKGVPDQLHAASHGDKRVHVHIGEQAAASSNHG